MSDPTLLTVDINCTSAGVFTLRVCAHGPHSVPAEHRRTAAAYRVASELELLASVEELAFTVDASAARDGIVTAAVTKPGDDCLDVMMEICIEGASNAGLRPDVDF